ncbi:hypothetical protein [Caballeronia sp. RCC_10]|uniref:hypothetical protein n=1 Tax=Caballeronia sp. RCC_10 TaxID=3239227 RepID=UPI0035233B39
MQQRRVIRAIAFLDDHPEVGVISPVVVTPPIVPLLAASIAKLSCAESALKRAFIATIPILLFWKN